MAGKGSRPRPFSVSQSKFDENWKLAFGAKKKMDEKEISLKYLERGDETGHQVPNAETISMWRDVRELTQFKNVMEIGFNAGHSASILLEMFDDVYVESYDICKYNITKKNAAIVKDEFGDRFNFFPESTRTVPYTKLKERFDLVFVDGDHSYSGVMNDYFLARDAKAPYALFDDLQNPGVKKFFSEMDDSLRRTYMKDFYYTSNTGRKVHARLVRMT